jgi:predicted nucleotidyltransferase
MDPDGSVAVPDRVKEILCEDSDVKFVVIFGSRERRTQGSGSDLDVAIKFSEELTQSERFHKRCHLSGQLQSDQLPFVDVSDIDELSIEFAHEAMNGTFVCGDESAFLERKESIEQTHEESIAERKHEQRAFINRIAEEGLRG